MHSILRARCVVFLGVAALSGAVITPAAALSHADLPGSWKLDTDAFWAEIEKSDASMSAMPAEQRDMMKPMITGMMGKMRFSFGPEGVTVTKPDGTKETQQPKKFTSTGPNTATVVSEENGKETTIKVEKVDAKTVKMIGPGPKGGNLTMIIHPADDTPAK